MTRTRSMIAASAVALMLAVVPDRSSATPSTFGVTVDPVGTFDAHTGQATITGTVSCGSTSGFVDLEGNLRQFVGRVSTVFGSFIGDVPACTPDASLPWSVTVEPTNGQFRGGSASANVRVAVDSSTAETSAPVKLKR